MNDTLIRAVFYSVIRALLDSLNAHCPIHYPRARPRIREQGAWNEGAWNGEQGTREPGAWNSTPEVINARLNYAEHDFLSTAKLWLLTIIERCYLSPISSSTRVGGFDA